ncbi:glycoside hydrolase family 13 protein, partial [Rhizoctonia solani]
GPPDVIIQMFGWNWDSIATECTSFIGPAGYGFVQVSPPSEHIIGPQWWTDYQPVSYNLTSKRGNRYQFENMVATCKNAGVGVIVDAVINHMTALDNGTGVAGSAHYHYPGIYDAVDFHHCGNPPGDDIADYKNRTQVQTCELLNLADLATDTEHVRSRLADYLNDLISLGVVGFRIDAAKHIAAEDLSNILNRLESNVYITQEVIFGQGEPTLPSEYAGNGGVQEFRYTSALQNAFQTHGVAGLKDVHSQVCWINPNEANVFVANHDTERNGQSLSYKSGSIYTLANVFMLAYPYGTPTILSSYAFSDSDTGAPVDGNGACAECKDANGWLCQHRWTAIQGMIRWRSGVTGSLNNWVAGTNQQIAFGRGKTGFVAINNADIAWTRLFRTRLPDNSYCDMVSGAQVGGRKCTGASYIVSGGILTATLPPRSAIGLFTDAIGTGFSPAQAGATSVVFKVKAGSNAGEDAFVVGSSWQLGNWVPEDATPLSFSDLTWSVSMVLPTGTVFSYKYLRITGNGTVIWESDPNRSPTVPESDSDTLVLNDIWQ